MRKGLIYNKREPHLVLRRKAKLMKKKVLSISVAENRAYLDFTQLEYVGRFAR